MAKYQKKPVVVDVMQWLNGETDKRQLTMFCGNDWTTAANVELADFNPEMLVVWNKLERFWVPVPIGHYIIRGLAGELYSCSPKVFDDYYVLVD